MNSANSDLKYNCCKPSKILLLLFILLNVLFDKISARCYCMDKNLTITGAEYKREINLNHRDCAKACLQDSCCMAYEWSLRGVCLLKSRSLNGTVSEKSRSRFGLCLVNDDHMKERDHFYDHELGGKYYATNHQLSIDQCIQFCEAHKDQFPLSGKSSHKRPGYSWSPSPSLSSSEPVEGVCNCIEVLNYVKLSFGSVSGYL